MPKLPVGRGQKAIKAVGGRGFVGPPPPRAGGGGAPPIVRGPLAPDGGNRSRPRDPLHRRSRWRGWSPPPCRGGGAFCCGGGTSCQLRISAFGALRHCRPLRLPPPREEAGDPP